MQVDSTIQLRRVPSKEIPCGVAGCNSKGQKIYGLCFTHYSKWRRLGRPELFLEYRPEPKTIRWTTETCTFVGCQSLVSQKGLCTKHYHRKRASIIREEFKKRAVALMGNRCLKCNTSYKCYAVYDFHHRDPSSKSVKANMGTINKWSRYWAEVQKCDMICSNCHREITFNERHQISARTEQQRIDKFGPMPPLARPPRKGRHYYKLHCHLSGHAFNSTRPHPKLCPCCSRSLWDGRAPMRKGPKPKYKVEQFTALLGNELTLAQIGNKLGMSGASVFAQLKRYGLKTGNGPHPRKKSARELSESKLNQIADPGETFT